MIFDDFRALFQRTIHLGEHLWRLLFVRPIVDRQQGLEIILLGFFEGAHGLLQRLFPIKERVVMRGRFMVLTVDPTVFGRRTIRQNHGGKE